MIPMMRDILNSTKPTGEAFGDIYALNYPNYRSGEFKDKIIHNPGTPSESNIIKDQCALLKEVLSKEYKEKIVLMGYSLGTAAALGAVERLGDSDRARIDRMLLINPFTNAFVPMAHTSPIAYGWPWALCCLTGTWKSSKRIGNEIFKNIPVMVCSNLDDQTNVHADSLKLYRQSFNSIRFEDAPKKNFTLRDHSLKTTDTKKILRSFIAAEGGHHDYKKFIEPGSPQCKSLAEFLSEERV